MPEFNYQDTATSLNNALVVEAEVQESITEAARARKYHELYEAFSAVAEDSEEISVEYAIYAQAEVMLSDNDGWGEC